MTDNVINSYELTTTDFENAEFGEFEKNVSQLYYSIYLTIMDFL